MTPKEFDEFLLRNTIKAYCFALVEDQLDLAQVAYTKANKLTRGEDYSYEGDREREIVARIHKATSALDSAKRDLEKR